MTESAKVAIITGASRGIGAGLVAGFRSLGYSVVANSRSIGASGEPWIISVAGDIAEPAIAEKVVASAIEHFGRVDTLVNNAGVFVAKPFESYSAEDFESVLHTNLAGFFNVSQLAIMQMLKQGSGHIVNVTTSLVEVADSKVPSVLASLTKGGLASAIKSLAIEYASRGIRANAVSPGIVQTPMHDPTTYEGLAGLHPLKRMGTIDDVVRGVLYLEQSPFVTGEFLHVDGGQSAGR
ncbi:SDR family NAD(P)-dependent oxidoreductase [Arthrobacter sp. B2a2-09]|uniref:SDR family NAD(P)-dependent oxidoreductase n=1 Tax=Arthrobacter sp. B2a2-09 TaxID=2952822 RepID=UPI0022CDBA60|nr:SDR family oxidoreductase [Arthrobacter sp. B2a2-09]MCZ9880342.1 SDR family oxidoreductase [Arthrobacter sp. B2a2-09]